MSSPVSVPTVRERAGVLAFAIFATVLPAVILAAALGVAVSEIWSHHLESDRLLFARGSARAFETVRLALPLWRGAAVLTLPSLACLSFLALFVWSAVLDAFCHPGHLRPRDVAGSATAHVGTFAVLAGALLLVRGLVLGATGLLATAVAPALSRDGSERTKTMVFLGALAVGLFVLDLVRIVHDLAMAAAARHEEGALPSSLTALAMFRESFASLLWARALYVGGVVLVALAGIGLGTLLWESPLALFLRTSLHFAAIAILVVLRAAWLRSLVVRASAHELPPQLVDEPSDL